MTSREFAEINKFISRVRILIPFVVFVLLTFFFPVFILFKSGEIIPLDTVVEDQQNNLFNVFGLAYTNQDKAYKIKTSEALKPDVLVIGTSRSEQFRKQFFTSNTKFYNASLAAAKMRHVQQFLSKISQSKTPEIVILVLDQNWFNDSYDKKFDDNIDIEINRDNSPLRIIRDNWLEVYKEYFLSHKFLISQVWTNKFNNVGLNGVINGNGFRPDGSYYERPFINDPLNPKWEDYQFRDTNLRIKNGDRRFEYGQTVSKERISELNELLKFCKKHNIYLITFLPPYAHEIFLAMKNQESNHYGYFFKIYPTINPLFQNYGYPLFDFSDLKALELNDSNMLDGSHPSEKVTATILVRMAENDKRLIKYVSIPFLQELINNNKNPYLYFP